MSHSIGNVYEILVFEKVVKILNQTSQLMLSSKADLPEENYSVNFPENKSGDSRSLKSESATSVVERNIHLSSM